MNKSLEADIKALAQKISKLDSEHLYQLKTLTQELYEKLTILNFVEENISSSISSIEKQPIENHPTAHHRIEKEPEDQSDQEEIAPSAEELSSAVTPEEEEVSTQESNAASPEASPISAEKEHYAETTIPHTEEPSKEGIAEQTPTKNNREESAESQEEVEEIDFRNIAVSFDELPNFEPMAPSNQASENKNSKTEIPSEDSSQGESEKETQQSPAPGLFSQQASSSHKKSLNDTLNNGLKFGLNDRLSFINHLFEGNAADFNRVVSQLNTFNHFKEAKSFIEKQIKPDYNWREKTEYEERFLAVIERKMS